MTAPSPAPRARPLVMGIVNVTPDSFSDGGRFAAADRAAEHARRLALEGAAIIDIGGESTRPGFTPVSAEGEIARVLPVLERLYGSLGVPVSIDTTKSAVARRALAAGATVVNDIWGLQGDPHMAEVAAETGAEVVVMANRAEPDGSLVMADALRHFFDASLRIAERAGLPHERLILDPGIGFGKTPRQQVEAIAAIPHLLAYGLPVLVGLSRKSFLGRITGTAIGDRLAETIAANVAAFGLGATLFRVHDVKEHVAALAIYATIEEAGRHHG